ncbi:hypothetical protein EDM57_20450 [Brevibacillus gelatini]|uniref:Uncharacterized protein n=1 Tax=Brevibacillus gelatini TaxID=1655277 RepID=A0A3M8AP52_9BACL|nr:hypothetical protein EDM57_20450 [Brevibacillus gelatini]
MRRKRDKFGEEGDGREREMNSEALMLVGFSVNMNGSRRKCPGIGSRKTNTPVTSSTSLQGQRGGKQITSLVLLRCV